MLTCHVLAVMLNSFVTVQPLLKKTTKKNKKNAGCLICRCGPGSSYAFKSLHRTDQIRIT